MKRIPNFIFVSLVFFGGIWVLVSLSGFSYLQSHDTGIPQVPHVAGISTTDWPQVAKDPQHTGFSSETLGTNFQVKWTRAFQPEKVFPQVQAIVAGGKAFVATEMGNLYALDAVTGAQSWKYTAGSPILNSVATDGINIYFASLDGAVYAVNFSGQLVWKQYVFKGQIVQAEPRLGFSGAPIIADSKVMVGGRDGYFYAFNPSNGSLLWAYSAGSPILQTAAWNNGKVYFGTQDMFVHAVNTFNGSQTWKSARLYGGGFVEYWPVVHQGKIIIRSMAREAWREARSFPNIGFPFVTAWSSSDPMWSWLQSNNAQLIAGNASQIADFMNAQNTAIANYNTNPNNYIKNLYILDESSGQQAVVAPHWANNTMNGTTAPPCVDRDNKLVMSVLFVRSAWGRLDLQYGGTGTTPRIVDVLYDGLDYNNQQVYTSKQNPKGTGNPDENFAVSCSQNHILTFHRQELNAHFTGYFNLITRKWTQVPPGHTNKQLWTNTQGGGASQPTIANGFVYHISENQLIARSTN